MTQYLFIATIVALATGCGGGAGHDDAPLTVPSEQALCALTIGQSSRADALRALGSAAASSAGVEHSSLDYQYGDFSRATSVSEVAALSLVFDEDEIFRDATVVNIPFPRCWKDQQARQSALSAD